MEDKLKEAIAHLEEAHKILVGFFPDEKEEKPEKKPIKVEIKVKNLFDENIDLDDKELEQIRKYLEEIMNDFTRK